MGVVSTALKSAALLLALNALFATYAFDESFFTTPVAYLTLNITRFDVDNVIFTCERGRLSFSKHNCYLIQRFCVGVGGPYSVVDTIQCRKAIKNGLLTTKHIQMFERWIIIKEHDSIKATATRQTVKNLKPATKLKNGFYNCSDASQSCYPYTLKMKIPPAVSVAENPLLYLVLAEFDMKYDDVKPDINGKSGRKSAVIFQNSFKLSLPHPNPNYVFSKTAGNPWVAIRHHTCASTPNSHLAKLKNALLGLVKPADSKGRQLLLKIFDTFAGFWDPSYKSTDTKMTESNSKVCLDTAAATKCLEGFGPPGDCRFLPCGKLAHKQSGQRQTRSVDGQKSSPCGGSESDEGFTTGEKVTVGVSVGSASIILGAVAFCLRKFFSVKPPKYTKAVDSSDTHTIHTVYNDFVKEDDDRIGYSETGLLRGSEDVNDSNPDTDNGTYEAI